MTLIVAGAEKCIDAGIGMIDVIFFLLTGKQQDIRAALIMMYIALPRWLSIGGGCL